MTKTPLQAGYDALRLVRKHIGPMSEDRDALRALAARLADIADTTDQRDMEIEAAVREVVRSHADLREHRDRLEEVNTELRDQVDQLEADLDHVREGLEDRSSEVTQLERTVEDLREQRDRLSEQLRWARQDRDDHASDARRWSDSLYEVARQREAHKRELADVQARVDAYLAHHVKYRLYGPCGHSHASDDPAVVYDAPDTGPACEDGYVASVCTECCMEPDIEPTLTVEHDHTHDPDQCWPCAPRRALTPEEPR